MGTLYENLVSLCEEKGITGGKMCTDIGLSKGLMTGLKKGRRSSISMDSAQKIADYFGVSVDRVLGAEEKEKPTAEVSSELNDEGIKLAESLNSVANEMVDIIVAIKKDPLYRPEMVVKTVEVVCPLSGKIEKIEQSYVAHNGSRVPLPNNGCSQFSSCAECFMCQLRVMESVR
jgi:transcriptional regulator with XRE-family HTH domain